MNLNSMSYELAYIRFTSRQFAIGIFLAELYYIILGLRF